MGDVLQVVAVVVMIGLWLREIVLDGAKMALAKARGVERDEVCDADAKRVIRAMVLAWLHGEG